MKFKWEGQEIFLQGLSSGHRSSISLQKWLTSGGPFPHSSMSSDLGDSNQFAAMIQPDPPLELQHLLDTCEGMFRNPTGLPPSRPHDHCINLLHDHAPICVRPYRYPHIQKTEIEKQVRELLSLGMIRPSKSAFSSPVILVRKKDASW